MSEDAETGLLVLLVVVLVMGALLFVAAWLGDAVECADKTCPAGQEPALVGGYSNLTGAACSCVLQ